MAGQSQVPPAQALVQMSMDELIVSFNASLGPGRGGVEGPPSFWSQQIMHKQQLSVAERMHEQQLSITERMHEQQLSITERMEKATRKILWLTVVITVATIFNLLIAAFS